MALLFRYLEFFKRLLENVIVSLLEHHFSFFDDNLVFFPFLSLVMLASVFETDSFDFAGCLFSHPVREGKKFQEVIFIELSIIIANDLHQAMFDQILRDNLITVWLCLEL